MTAQTDGGQVYGPDLACIHHAGFYHLAAAAAPALVKMLAAAGIRDGLVVDLGCGSGIVARELTDRGYDVLGIDVSPAMVERAREVAPRARFVAGSMHAMTFPRCRAVVAIGESISYLPPRGRRRVDVRSLFGRIARALEPGGVFVFDVIVSGRPLMVYRTWQAGPDWAVLVDVSEDPATRLVTRRITAFRDRGRGYQRSGEHHVVGVYDRREAVTWLAEAGFSVSVQRRYGDVELPARRLAFAARRQPVGRPRR